MRRNRINSTDIARDENHIESSSGHSCSRRRERRRKTSQSRKGVDSVEEIDRNRQLIDQTTFAAMKRKDKLIEQAN